MSNAKHLILINQCCYIVNILYPRQVTTKVSIGGRVLGVGGRLDVGSVLLHRGEQHLVELRGDAKIGVVGTNLMLGGE